MKKIEFEIGGILIGHWHIRIGKFWLGFWRDDIVGWGKFIFPEYKSLAFGIGEIRWYL